MKLQSRRLYAVVAGLGGCLTFVYGINLLLAGLGFDWAFVVKERPVTRVVFGVALVLTGVMCTIFARRIARVLRRVEQHEIDRARRAIRERAGRNHEDSLNREHARSGQTRPL